MLQSEPITIEKMNKNLLNNIMNLIKKYNLSECECMELCSVHKNFISNLRNGKLKRTSLENVLKIATVFHVSVDHLICCDTLHNKDDLSKQEIRKNYTVFKRAYNRLNNFGKDNVNTIIEREFMRCQNELEKSID